MASKSQASSLGHSNEIIPTMPTLWSLCATGLVNDYARFGVGFTTFASVSSYSGQKEISGQRGTSSMRPYSSKTGYGSLEAEGLQVRGSRVRVQGLVVLLQTSDTWPYRAPAARKLYSPCFKLQDVNLNLGPC